MAIIVQFLVWIAGFILVLWAIGAAWNRWWWVKDGRPYLTQAEHLAVDLLQARGFTTTAARRKVVGERRNDVLSEINVIRETEDLLFNPARESELRQHLTKHTDNLGGDPPNEN